MTELFSTDGNYGLRTLSEPELSFVEYVYQLCHWFGNPVTTYKEAHGKSRDEVVNAKVFFLVDGSQAIKSNPEHIMVAGF
jgi:hypothetical protein